MNFLKLAACVALCELAGALGSVFAFPALTPWYAQLAKPFFAPPNWVFAPVWILLYALMGWTLYLVLESRHAERKRALAFFGIQLSLNAVWSFAFFGLRSPVAGFLVIVLLLASIAACLASFNKFSRKAFWLFVPYAAWVSFASLLNAAVWLLNP
jgi:benzodiazapine receptor